jgi:hypothetical protein
LESRPEGTYTDWARIGGTNVNTPAMFDLK